MPKQKIVIEYESDEPIFPSGNVTIGKPNRGFDGVSWLQDFLRECSKMHIVTPNYIFSKGHYTTRSTPRCMRTQVANKIEIT
jgi:hypothetical protein